MAPEIFASLENSLLEKSVILSRLVNLATEHKDALIAHNVDILPEINNRQTEELSRLDKVQKSSNKLLARLCSAVGLNEPPASISQLASRLPDRQRERLEELSEHLTGLASELALASEVNANLSANALEFVRFTLQAISCNIRDNNPTAGQPPSSLVLDAQA